MSTTIDDPQLWRAALADAPARVELPVPDPAAGHAGSARDTVLLPEADWTRGERLVATVAGTLARYSVAGTVVLTVGEAGVWVPLVLDLAADPTLADVLPAVDAARAFGRAHLVALADLAGDTRLSETAVGQVALALDDTAWPSPDPAVLEVRAGEAGPQVTAAAATLATVSGHLARIGAGWAGDVSLSTVPMLSPVESAAEGLLARGDPLDLVPATVWDLVRAQARRTPGALAVDDTLTRLTYAELVAAAGAVARDLLAIGVGAGDLVGLAPTRSTAMVVGLFGVLAVGAAYVPIDASYPPDRVAMMVEDAELTVVVTRPELLDVPAFADLEKVVVDPAARAEPPTTGPAAADRAYVIFTSGSTGRPKGVVIGHRALTNFCLAIARRPGLGATDRLLAVTTLSFDIAGLELMVPLTVGGTVLVAGPETVGDPHALAARMDDDAVTVVQATPATWQMLVDSGWTGRASLRVFCGGEALPTALAAALQSRCGQLWNLYGPTEATIWATATQLLPGDPVTIGSPLHNTTLRVAGRHREALPAGTAGELMIGGDGLADGYLGRPQQTADRFVLVTDAGAPPARYYRTGDLVRRRADGRIDFLGRMDNQVKVRGHRIELGDVEAALDAHPAVARGVAVVRPDPREAANVLLAFATLRPHATAVDGRTLRRHLARLLPGYMVPSSVVVLDEFAYTPNGKIDRAALVAVRSGPRDRVAPRTPLEGQLVELWQRVLGIDTVGVTDDLFDLGVSSLATARLFTAISRECAVDLPVSAVFEAPTVALVAERVERSRTQGSDAGAPGGPGVLVPIRTDGTERPLFLVHGGAGTVLLFEPLARLLPADVPVYALQAAGLYGDEGVQRSVTAMAARYVREIRAVAPHGPYRLGGYCFGALVAFEMACQLDAAGETTELLVSFNGPSPSYLGEYRPVFDAQGARNDEFGRPLPRTIEQAGPPPTGVNRLLGAGRGRVARARRDAGLYRRAVSGRPLPESLREHGGFQRIAEVAQARYRPGRWVGTMTVMRANGLYHRDDLGWGDHVDGAVEVVAGGDDTITPRQGMTAPHVGPMAAELSARLRSGAP